MLIHMPFCHILPVGSLNWFSWKTKNWSPISAQVTGLKLKLTVLVEPLSTIQPFSHPLTFNFRNKRLLIPHDFWNKWSLDSMYEMNCQGEITPRTKIKPAIPGWQVSLLIEIIIIYNKHKHMADLWTKIQYPFLVIRRLSTNIQTMLEK